MVVTLNSLHVVEDRLDHILVFAEVVGMHHRRESGGDGKDARNRCG